MIICYVAITWSFLIFLRILLERSFRFLKASLLLKILIEKNLVKSI